MFFRVQGLPRLPRRLIRQYCAALEGDNAWLEFYGAGRHRPAAVLQPRNARVSAAGIAVRSFAAQSGTNAPLASLQPLDLCRRPDHVARTPACLQRRPRSHDSSVETRYPYLDEDVVDFTARLDPRWKMRGLRDKYLLRRVAQRWLPPPVAWRRKSMFMAPFDSFHRQGARRPAVDRSTLECGNAQPNRLF